MTKQGRYKQSGEQSKKHVHVSENGHTGNKSGCPISKKCGGCQYIDKSYAEQLKIKTDQVKKLLAPYGSVDEIIGMKEPYHYRNKVNAAFQHKRNGEILAGVYEEGTHRVLSVDDCKIENRLAQEIVETIRGLLRSFKITVYNEDSGYGLLRHVMIRTGHATGEVMVVLVTASPIFPSKKNFAKALVKAHPQITTIVQNINDKDTSMVLGERNQVLYGRGFIEDKLCGKTFKISPTSFYQVNPVQTELLYNKAMEYANLTGEEVVVDAYCGTGTIGIVASDHAKQVIGVELNKAAAKDAITNVKRNECKNVRIYDGDAGKFMVGMAEAGTDVDVVFLDPPRSGSTPEFFDSVCKLAPKRIVYISCGPESLARDLKYLKSKRMYQVEKIALVDLFPWTEHCETVVLLSKGEIDSKKVRVEFSLEDMDMSGFQKGATYEQIKAYVLEHTGLKVSSLYISQIKRKCGLDVGQNYNLSKKEDAKVPKCPPEKEAAIRDALKYFQMI